MNADWGDQRLAARLSVVWTMLVLQVTHQPRNTPRRLPIASPIGTFLGMLAWTSVEPPGTFSGRPPRCDIAVGP